MKKFELVITSEFNAFLPEKEKAELEEKLAKAVNRVLLNSNLLGNFHVKDTKVEIVEKV